MDVRERDRRDLLAARTHAHLWGELASRGEPIGAHDLWIAATCVGRGLTLATGNARDFRKVPGLDLEVWGPADPDAAS